MREQLIKALLAHAQGDIQKHVANVEVYLTNPAGIGEHSDITEAVIAELDKLSAADDRLEMINKSKIIKDLSYEHPLFTINGVSAQKRKREISGQNNTYYCGAYWHNGFHEDGVVSALDVCSQFGESL